MFWGRRRQAEIALTAELNEKLVNANMRIVKLETERDAALSMLKSTRAEHAATVKLLEEQLSRAQNLVELHVKQEVVDKGAMARAADQMRAQLNGDDDDDDPTEDRSGKKQSKLLEAYRRIHGGWRPDAEWDGKTVPDIFGKDETN